MKRSYYILISIVLLAFIIAMASSPNIKLSEADPQSKNVLTKVEKIQIPENPPQNVKQNLNCKTCHETEYPTRNYPGLRECPRENLISVYHQLKEGPEVVVIDAMSDYYTGVVFSHNIHAEMSEMSEGCTGCHHYNTTGPVLKCQKCHQNNRARDDVSIPDLKAAYHRQCMTCHKQWSNENGCNTQCHFTKSSQKQPSVDVIKSKIHPKLTEPTKIVWETDTKTNKIVTFFHDEHIQLFNLGCTSCHSQESCIKCHSKLLHPEIKSPVKIDKSIEEHHKPCIKCHLGNSCEKCHSEKELAPFDHGRSSGWSLNTHHSNVACSKCHGKRMPYRRLDKNCVSCHENFASSFNHELIGLVFSEAHEEIECGNCHSKREFIDDPVCTDCHDDKSYPAELPGEKAK